MVVRTIRLAFAASAVVFILVAVFGELVLETVGGEEFGRAYHTLLWLAGAACVELVVVAFEPSIMAAHRAQYAFLTRLAGTAVMIGGAFVLEPIMGAEGVAAAVLASSLTQALMLGGVLAWLVRHGEIVEQPEAEEPPDSASSN
jgi:O-antigen/teichoic acid export membrane protein